MKDFTIHDLNGLAYYEALEQTEQRMRRVFLMKDATPINEEELIDYADECEMIYDQMGNIIG